MLGATFAFDRQRTFASNRVCVYEPKQANEGPFSPDYLLTPIRETDRAVTGLGRRTDQMQRRKRKRTLERQLPPALHPIVPVSLFRQRLRHGWTRKRAANEPAKARRTRSALMESRFLCVRRGGKPVSAD